eukprot:COSAG02_NODE_14202_length_1298_cov_1.042535_1_plen_241_part_10
MLGLLGQCHVHGASQTPAQAAADVAAEHSKLAGAHNLHNQLGLVDGVLNRILFNPSTEEYDIHDQVTGGVGAQVPYNVVLDAVLTYENVLQTAAQNQARLEATTTAAATAAAAQEQARTAAAAAASWLSDSTGLISSSKGAYDRCSETPSTSPTSPSWLWQLVLPYGRMHCLPGGPRPQTRWLCSAFRPLQRGGPVPTSQPPTRQGGKMAQRHWQVTFGALGYRVGQRRPDHAGRISFLN